MSRILPRLKEVKGMRIKSLKRGGARRKSARRMRSFAMQKNEFLLQTVDHVEIGEGADVAVDVGLGIGRDCDSADGVDASRVQWNRVLPQLSFSSRQLDRK